LEVGVVSGSFGVGVSGVAVLVTAVLGVAGLGVGIWVLVC